MVAVPSSRDDGVASGQHGVFVGHGRQVIRAVHRAVTGRCSPGAAKVGNFAAGVTRYVIDINVDLAREPSRCAARIKTDIEFHITGGVVQFEIPGYFRIGVGGIFRAFGGERWRGSVRVGL